MAEPVRYADDEGDCGSDKRAEGVNKNGKQTKLRCSSSECRCGSKFPICYFAPRKRSCWDEGEWGYKARMRYVIVLGMVIVMIVTVMAMVVVVMAVTLGHQFDRARYHYWTPKGLRSRASGKLQVCV